jgi:cob(I)alamin adenosyltransferase
MVTLSRIYTRTGDDGTTGLVGTERRLKCDVRIDAYGTVDEANAAIGLARIETAANHPAIDAMLSRIQNDLFDVGADLATPHSKEPPKYEPLRATKSQVDWVEQSIDTLNADLKPLNSFVLPGGTPAAAALHLARTITRRAERLAVELAQTEQVNPLAIHYLNRLSDFLFVASRSVNDNGALDVLWVPGANR